MMLSRVEPKKVSENPAPVQLFPPQFSHEVGGIEAGPPQ